MKTLVLISLQAALVSFPAMGATYIVDETATDQTSVTYQGNTPGSFALPAGIGAKASGDATNIDHGYAAASASLGIADPTQFYSQYGLSAYSTTSVQYTMRIVGPVTDALIPVTVSMLASATAIAITGNTNPALYNLAAISAHFNAQVTLDYSDYLPNLPALPSVSAATHYDYRYWNNPQDYPAPVVNAQSDAFNGVVLMAANENIEVDVSAVADAYYPYSTTISGIGVSGGAVADPSFTLDPAFASAYTITGVPDAPASAVPEPATWAMLATGFGAMGLVARRRTRKVARA